MSNDVVEFWMIAARQKKSVQVTLRVQVFVEKGS